MIKSADYEHMLSIARKAKKEGFDYTVFNNEHELVAVFKEYRDFMAFDSNSPEPDYIYYNMRGIDYDR